MFYNRQIVPNWKTHHVRAFLYFHETLLLDFLEMNFSKMVLVIIL